jgi:Protein of unknown function (DUF4232)
VVLAIGDCCPGADGRPAGAAGRAALGAIIIMTVHRCLRAAGLAVLIGTCVSACAGSAGAGASGTTSPGASRAGSAGASSTARAARCQGSQLRIRLIYGGPAAGTVGAVIGFTNEGRTACRLSGWPGLVAVGPAGEATAKRTLDVFAGPALTAAPVTTIRPGALAVAVVAGSDNPGPGMTTCPPAYRRLRVTPPGSVSATVISAWIRDDDAYLPACSRLELSPVIRPSDLPFLKEHHI